MGVEQAPTAKGKQAAKGLRQAAAKDERKTEAETGHPLKKGAAPSRTLPNQLSVLPYHEAKDRVVADFERVYFAEVMKDANFDMKVAEQKTGLSMQSLYRLLKKNGLRLKDLKNAEGLDK